MPDADPEDVIANLIGAANGGLLLTKLFFI